MVFINVNKIDSQVESNYKYNIGDSNLIEDNSILTIKVIEEAVKLHKYTSGEELKSDLLRLSDLVWKDIKDVYKDDLKKVSLVHSYLINQVIEIHRMEESEVNNHLIMNNINVRNIINKIEDGKRASRMYFLNDEDFEYYFIGDIHSDDYILECILNDTDFFNKIVKGDKIRLIFLGDYVDRGKSHLKTMEKIMILKSIFPGNIFLIQGNHDGGNIENDVVRLCVGKPSQDKDEDYFLLYIDNLTKVNPSLNRGIIKKYLELFKSMAILSFVESGDKILCGVHGGIPRPLRGEESLYGYINSLKDITDELKTNERGENIISNILWSDPLLEEIDSREHTRRFGFKEEEFNIYAERVGIDYLIRGHEANEDGVKSFFNERVYCIFGSGQILKDGFNSNPSTAYGWVKPKLLKVDRNSGINIIDLSGK